MICRYLDARAGSKLYLDGDAMWEVLTLEALADGIMDAAVVMTYEMRLRPVEMQMPDWIDAQWDKAARAVKALETSWMPRLAGPLNMGQIAVGCALAYLDFRHGARSWRTGNDALAAWFEAFSQRESFLETTPPDGA